MGLNKRLINTEAGLPLITSFSGINVSTPTVQIEARGVSWNPVDQKGYTLERDGGNARSLIPHSGLNWGQSLSIKTFSSSYNGLAFDSSGYYYVGNGSTLEKYNLAGTLQTSWSIGGTIVDIAIDSNDWFYISLSGNSNTWIYNSSMVLQGIENFGNNSADSYLFHAEGVIFRGGLTTTTVRRWIVSSQTSGANWTNSYHPNCNNNIYYAAYDPVYQRLWNGQNYTFCAWTPNY